MDEVDVKLEPKVEDSDFFGLGIISASTRLEEEPTKRWSDGPTMDINESAVKLEIDRSDELFYEGPEMKMRRLAEQQQQQQQRHFITSPVPTAFKIEGEDELLQVLEDEIEDEEEKEEEEDEEELLFPLQPQHPTPFQPHLYPALRHMLPSQQQQQQQQQQPLYPVMRPTLLPPQQQQQQQQPQTILLYPVGQLLQFPQFPTIPAASPPPPAPSSSPPPPKRTMQWAVVPSSSSGKYVTAAIPTATTTIPAGRRVIPTETPVTTVNDAAAKSFAANEPNKPNKLKKASVDASTHSTESAEPPPPPSQPPKDGRFECCICHQSFNHKCSMERHFKRHFDKSVSKCHRCGTEHDNAVKLLQHIKATHAPKDNPLSLKQCIVCGVTYSRRHYLIVHVRQAHKLQMCEFCYELFATPDELEVHTKACKHTIKHLPDGRLDLHTPSPKPPEPCEKTRTRIQEMLTLNERCDICGTGYRQRHYLATHVKREHKLEMCMICCKLVHTPDELEKHRDDEHTVPSIPYHDEHTVPRVSLDVPCKKENPQKACSDKPKIILLPQASSTPLRNRCDLCGIQYVRLPSLKLHAKQIHDREICIFCCELFATMDKLDAHVKVCKPRADVAKTLPEANWDYLNTF